MSDEAGKVRQHLQLLREEYVKLQARHAELEKKYHVAAASAGDASQDTFVSRLLQIVCGLFDSPKYSDLVIKLAGREIKGHKFVLQARSDTWGLKDLEECTELDLTDIPHDVALALMKWVYSDEVNTGVDDGFLLDLLRAAMKFQLTPLSDRCEQALMSSVTVSNCLRFYQTAEEIGAEALKDHCSELVSNHWHDFSSSDFEDMPAALAYRMFKAKTRFPLHTAIRTRREDVVFLYLVEHDSQLPEKLDELDDRGDIALDLSLQGQLEGICQTLVKHKVDVDRRDSEGLCLLHKAIKRGDEFSAKFLIDNRADVNAETPLKETALHLVADFNPEVTTAAIMEGMAGVARLLLVRGCGTNSQDSNGNTALHRAITSHSDSVFSVLLEETDLKLELQNNVGHTTLGLALHGIPPGGQFGEESFASRLIKKGSSPNATNSDSGDSLLHKAARNGNEAAGLFLAKNGANGSINNHKGETPLHTACQQGLAELCQSLLEKGANPNAQTASVLDPTSEDVYRQTPLHLAINNRHLSVVKVFLAFKAHASTSGNSLQIIPNFTLKDSQDQSVLALALWQNFHDIAMQLIAAGANINDYNTDGLTLLHQAIKKQDTSSALFLLEQQADCNAKTRDDQTCLDLAIKCHLVNVVDALCQRGANMNIMTENGSCPLWEALDTGQEDIATILVRHGCDTDIWGPGPSNCRHTLLHRAIDENNASVACFLVRSQCDINSPRRPGPNGEGDEEARDGQGPLHMAATWGLENVVQCLVEFNADVNAQDAEGKTPLHIAIENQHPVIISLLMSHPGLSLTLRDKQGLTPFAVAMNTKNNKAAQAILDREPTATEQFDNKGRNFLHMAIQKSDIESVLFLIAVHANVNSRVQDSTQLTPLHLAVQSGSEIIARNLILAGADVNATTPQKQTALHFAALFDKAPLVPVLVSNTIDFDAVDSGLNNALHLAVQKGHLATVRALLTESHINAEAINMKGQNALHILGQFGRENAAAIFDLFVECMPDYPVDKPDANGCTALLLAYFNGNGNLCRAIVRAGATLGVPNKDGVSIFNAPVATKQLLFKLLDMLSKEPPWCEGEHCLECSVKFGIKTRKHHCRHCGRLLCSKCSDKDMPIIKYGITKPVRVCVICFDVLTLGMTGGV